MPDDKLMPLSLPFTTKPLMDLSPLQGLTPASLKIIETFTATGEVMNVEGYKRVLYDKANDVYIGLVSNAKNYLVVIDRKTKLMLCSFLYTYTGCGDTNNLDEVVDIVLNTTLTPKPPVEEYYYQKSMVTDATTPVDGQQENTAEEGELDPDVLEQTNQTVTEALIRAAACGTSYYASGEGRITLEGTQEVEAAERKVAEISMLVVNTPMRTAYIVRVRLDLVRQPTTVEGRPVSILTGEDIVSFIELVPRGTAFDEMALPLSEEYLDYKPLVSWQGALIEIAHSRYYLFPGPEHLIPMLKDRLYLGEFQTPYCGLALTATGKYVILLAGKTTCWLTPFLSFPVYTQYMLSIDDASLGLTWTYLGPTEKAFSWDETTKAQPFYHNPTIYDGRYLLMQYDVKSRILGLKQQSTTSYQQPGKPEYLIYFVSGRDWEGGYKANVLYPTRGADVREDVYGVWQGARRVLEDRHWYGYPDTWDTPNPQFEPQYRESYWVRIDMEEITRNLSTDSLQTKLKYQHVAHYHDGNVGAPLTIQDNDITFANGPVIAHCYMNYVTFFEEATDKTDHPLDSILFHGIVPGQKMTKIYKVKNLSENGSVENLRLCMSAEDIPQGVTVSINEFPEVLGPGEEANFLISLTYVIGNNDCTDCPCIDLIPTPPAGEEGNTYKCCNCPAGDVEPLSSIDIPMSLEYYMAWETSSWNPSVIDEATAATKDLKLALDLSKPNIDAGVFQIDIPFDYLYTLERTSTTTVESAELKASEPTPSYGQFYWANPATLAVAPAVTTISARRGDSPMGPGEEYVSYSYTYPRNFTVDVELMYKPQSKRVWIMNRSDMLTYDVALELIKASAVTHNDTGFFVVEYPRGNLLKPNEHIPITLHWVPNAVPNTIIKNTTTSVNVTDAMRYGEWESITVNTNRYIFPKPSASWLPVAKMFCEYTEKMIAVESPRALTAVINSMSLFYRDAVAAFQGDAFDRVAIPMPAPTGPAPLDLPLLAQTPIAGDDQGNSTIGSDPEANWEAEYIKFESLYNEEYFLVNPTEAPFHYSPATAPYYANYDSVTEYGTGQIVKTNSVFPMPLLPTGYKLDRFLQRVIPCDSTGKELDYWHIKLEDYYTPEDFMAALVDPEDRFFEATVEMKNISANDVKVVLNLENSKSHPLFPLADVKYPNGDTIPAGAILQVTAVFRVHGTFARLGYMNMVKDTVLVPYLNVRSV